MYTVLFTFTFNLLFISHCSNFFKVSQIFSCKLVLFVLLRTMFVSSVNKMTSACWGTGAQEWLIVSLLVDVTSPTTVAHYVSMSDLRVLSTEKHWPPTEQHTAYTNKHLQCVRTKFIVHHWTSREGSLRHSSGWGLKRFSLSSVFCAPVV